MLFLWTTATLKTSFYNSTYHYHMRHSHLTSHCPVVRYRRHRLTSLWVFVFSSFSLYLSLAYWLSSCSCSCSCKLLSIQLVEIIHRCPLRASFSSLFSLLWLYRIDSSEVYRATSHQAPDQRNQTTSDVIARENWWRSEWTRKRKRRRRDGQLPAVFVLGCKMTIR